ncbi:MAG: ABC transporter ATP-binding protein [Myxococcota bacterium]|nr:ABC transporter ATP-binding protein [Myxococcota bacterium]
MSQQQPQSAPEGPAEIPAEPAERSREAGSGVRIEARGLTRRFGPHVAVDALDLDIERGTAFGLLGANGAGKTTFIRMLTGILLPSAGTVSVDGISPALDPAAVRARLGFAPETSCLYPELRVRGFLHFAAGARGLSGAEAETAVEASLERFHLEEVTKRPIGQLSKGFQQRVSLAQAFLHEPPLVIVDEPTSGLDPLQQEEVKQVLADRRGRCTLILCTHDLGDARELTDEVGVLHAGRLVAHGPTPEILDRPEPLRLFRGEEDPA